MSQGESDLVSVTQGSAHGGRQARAATGSYWEARGLDQRDSGGHGKYRSDPEWASNVETSFTDMGDTGIRGRVKVYPRLRTELAFAVTGTEVCMSLC